MKYPVYKQLSAMDCGPCCLKMISEYHDKIIDIQYLHESCSITNEGVSLYGIAVAAKKLGFNTEGISSDIIGLKRNFTAPCILHWNQNHFVVLYEIFTKHGENRYKIGNPAFGSISNLTEEEFLQGWYNGITNEETGIALFLSKSTLFDRKVISRSNKYRINTKKKLISYLKIHKKSIFTVCFIVACSSLIQLILPFTSQFIVDKGIAGKNLNIIYLFLFGQLSLGLGQAICGFSRSWILMKVGTNINIRLLSDYLSKLMSLPISFFDVKFAGDIIQRINDHYRIQYFLTDNFIDTIFSFINIIIFGSIILYYNFFVAIIFFIGSFIYITWILMFLKKREDIDHKMFSLNSNNQNSIMQLIYGMQEIKLNTCESQKLQNWLAIQTKIKDWSLKGLKIFQYQQSGSIFINQVKDLIITAFVATLVVKGELSLGVMLSIQYIIGMLNSPITQLVSSLRQYQDAKLSTERLSDVYDIKPEDDDTEIDFKNKNNINDIVINNVSFKYDKTEETNIIDELSFVIPKGKITAIVGLSGSGKTTLMKLLLGFYTPDSGEIFIGNCPLTQTSKRLWRRECGIVMQDGFIFSDTIENNIAVGCDIIDYNRLNEVCIIANIKTFIDNLPLGYKTMVGNDGKSISLGQKQRILIARALYKKPKYLFLDEATNSLDAENESLISQSLETEFKGKSVIIIAHRLSTIKKADQIVVLKDGHIVEKGNHSELLKKKDLYYSLVKEQLNI